MKMGVKLSGLLMIFITGWWLCLELYLRRPFQSTSSSRLDTLLEAKAEQGVQIFIIGGLDLCFGRCDTMEHRVGDCPPHIWPRKDYYNPRESEPNSSEESMEDELERGKYPRMPWHDVHCALWGLPCRDVARHFVQHWNHAKVTFQPHFSSSLSKLIFFYIREIDIENKGEINQKDLNRQDSFPSRSPFEDMPPLCIPSRWSRTLRGCLNGRVEEVVFLKIHNGRRSLNLSKFESWYIF